eukprot:CAMPEP_0174261594 /NCGR_PEP_ID=MMETSP0439-20130205/11524_1 /TAXON_ID=0 /ORGANISM="Stereomyxa ramosa, Strain Chinc5" /LENGTH=338 /DNA_ID=CAMNT_0015346089 /DNA_START=62 /DNA_END=1075 /DNA_ORIENTATION=-
MEQSLANQVLDAWSKIRSGEETNVWVKPYEGKEDKGENDKHQFLFFLKPELTSDDAVHLDVVVESVLKTLEDAGISFGGVRCLGGDYLEKHSLMVEHYGVISKISKEGVSAISDDAKAKMEADYVDELAAGAKVMGGNQFLAEQPQFNAFSLIVLNDNVGTNRLAGGTYAMSIKVLGEPYILLNPFHAYQLVPYVTSKHGIIIFECFSTTKWADLRGNVCGTTDPSTAAEGSLRNLLLAGKDKFGLKDVDKGTNGVHMSAGPLEGMVELRRFFSDHETGESLSYNDLYFGRLLKAAGVSDERVSELADNINLSHEGANISSFDLTEEIDAVASVELLT